MTVSPETEGRLVVSFSHDTDSPRQRFDYLKARAVEELGVRLILALYAPGNGKTYTVRISEEEIKNGYYAGEYRLWADITKVEEFRHTPIMLPQYQSMGWAVLSTSALDEIKRRIRVRVRRIFRK